MIISASRRTDIPSHYSEWFLSRMKAGFVLVRNPRNFHQISRIDLLPNVVDGIVFWTKNPLPLLDRLDELKDIMFVFQFTLTAYGQDIEPNLPAKEKFILPAFQRLSDMIGPDRVIWRYDPIFFNEKYSLAYHLDIFDKIAYALRDCTRKVTISFIDTSYREAKRNLPGMQMAASNPEDRTPNTAYRLLAEIAHSHGLEIDQCAGTANLEQFGIAQARCIDDRLFAKLLGRPIHLDKDKYQRRQCACRTSVDIGMYNTCPNGCLYCYANYNHSLVAGNHAGHNPLSPLLSGEQPPCDTES
jgi:hypothetical protein